MLILITGGSGMVGSAFRSLEAQHPHIDFIYIESQDYDLRSPQQSEKMFSNIRPDQVIHLAAKVGGIRGNMNHMGEFYADNASINLNVLNAAHKFGCQKVVSLLSTCVYPDKAQHPLVEENIHTGEPHSSNFAYAYAKRMLDVQSRAFRQQYGSNFITAIPNNLYGLHDNFDTENGHVIPSLIRKFYEAQITGTPVVLWGDGKPIREFTFAPDIAHILLHLLENYDDEHPINIGNTDAISILDLALLVKKEIGYTGEIVWDITKPSGQFKKPSSNQKLLNLGWEKKNYTSLYSGLKKVCKWFKLSYPQVRGAR
jgi:GDP-L-fucose synthase|tara:strand:+ start:1377 stop:2315 length:939 start_codon:yes stop_codon:yes gene_type:complete